MLSRLFFFLLLSTVTTPLASGCTIPVFRFALDRWDADRFELRLPAGASQDAEMTDRLRPLRANGAGNLSIVTSKDPEQKQAELRFPGEGSATLWTGDLNVATLGAVLDSPARQELRARILAGESVVWVIADSGTPEDKAQRDRIEKRLQFLQQVAGLPIQDPNDPDSQLGPGPPLKLAFTVLRVQRDDPAEAVFLKMLAGPKGNIDPANTSFAAAIFGKGRVLGAWALDLLDDAALEDACLFLVGRCSCRVKDQNPGWDILMNVDWPKALAEVSAKKPAVETELPAMAEPVVVKTEPAPATPAPQGLSGKPYMLALVGVALALVAILTMSKRRKGD